MIYDSDTRPKSVTLFRIPFAGASLPPSLSPSDYIPMLTGGFGDARQWRPDGVMSSQASYQTDVAESPLADGSDVANHARRKPVSFTFEAVITDTPLIPFGTLGGLPGQRRADAILASLLDVWKSRSFVAMASPNLAIETALITNVDHARSTDDGSAHFVSVTILEVRTFAIRQLASIDDAAAQLGGARATSSGGVIFGT